MTGLERLLADPGRLKSAGRVGLLTNPSGVTRDLVPSAVALRGAGVALAHLFGPEHGVDGSGAPGEAPEIGADAATGLPTSSLYGKSADERAALLARVDTLLVDVQDVGVRFYTYISTLRQVLAAAREAGTRVVVLDRPNPLGFAVEGPVLRGEFRSFVGIAEMPLRHGLTLGETARFFQDDVEVVPCDPDEALPWVPPSPNLPDPVNVRVYPGACLVEATDASEGRGTALPFRLFGAPGLDPHALAARLNALDLPGARWRPAFFTPTTSKHAHSRCAGVQLHVSGGFDLAVGVGLALVAALVEGGALRNDDWLQKLLGVPAGEVPTAPEEAANSAERWRREALGFSETHFSRHWLYPRQEQSE